MPNGISSVAEKSGPQDQGRATVTESLGLEFVYLSLFPRLGGMIGQVNDCKSETKDPRKILDNDKPLFVVFGDIRHQPMAT